VENDIDKPGHLTRDEILEMQREGMHFGSHTLSHPDLTTISEQQAQKEIYESRTDLEKMLHAKISDFCFPGGAFNQDVENIVSNSGYRTAVTTNNTTNFGQTDPLQLNRLDIRDNTKFEDLPNFKQTP